MAVRIICALLATVFIAVLFQVRKENIFAAAIGGGLGCLVNECGLALGLGTFFSIFLASLALASYSEIMARVRKTTVTTFLISGLFPLVPGAGMYYTMLAIVPQRSERGAQHRHLHAEHSGSDGIGDLVCLHAVPRHQLFPKDQKHRQMTGAFLMVRGETKAVSHADGAAWMRTHATGSPYGTA